MKKVLKTLFFASVIFFPFFASAGNIHSGQDFTCAIKNDGSIQCWGKNDRGQLNKPSGNDFIKLRGRNENTCGIKKDGTTQCWGSNYYSSLNVPSDKLKDVSVGNGYGCGVTQDGTAKCWSSQSYSPLRTAPSGDDYIGVDSRVHRTCWQKEDLSIYCVTRDNIPYDLSGKKYLSFAKTYNSLCGIKEDKTIECTGRNDDIKNNIPNGTFTKIHASAYGNFCALNTSGSVDCWGSTKPTISNNSDFVDFSSFNDYGCGIKKDGSAQCWGGNLYGRATPPAGLKYSIPSASNGGEKEKIKYILACGPWKENSKGEMEAEKCYYSQNFDDIFDDKGKLKNNSSVEISKEEADYLTKQLNYYNKGDAGDWLFDFLPSYSLYWFYGRDYLEGYKNNGDLTEVIGNNYFIMCIDNFIEYPDPEMELIPEKYTQCNYNTKILNKPYKPLTQYDWATFPTNGLDREGKAAKWYIDGFPDKIIDTIKTTHWNTVVYNGFKSRWRANVTFYIFNENITVTQKYIPPDKTTCGSGGLLDIGGCRLGKVGDMFLSLFVSAVSIIESIKDFINAIADLSDYKTNEGNFSLINPFTPIVAYAEDDEPPLINKRGEELIKSFGEGIGKNEHNKWWDNMLEFLKWGFMFILVIVLSLMIHRG